ncbi:MAG: TPM domain-containing protein, partial [Burkholderiaceae bacterium]|nr:TPM domain-containing protein [Burkholderiaceae bacterium]
VYKRQGQDRERLINEGQAYANDVVPKARGTAARLIQEAEGYRTRVIETAQGDAARFRQLLVEYNRAPAVTRDRLYLETMQQIFASTTKVLIDTRANSNLLYLPLEKLLQQPPAEGTPPAPRVVPPPARVTDTTGTLSAREREALEAKLAAFEAAHGSQIAIVMVGSTAPEPIADFAQRLGEAWKIGRAGVGDGLLIVVAKDDRRVWIAVARALEGAVPDVAAKRVIREAIAPRFRQGDYAGGLAAGLDALFALIEQEGLPAPVGVSQRTVEAGEDVFALLVPFVLVGVVAGSMLRRLFGVPGALLAGAGSGALGGFLLSSWLLGTLIAVAAFLLALGSGSVFFPGGFGGGFRSGGFGGGFRSGGGGDFAGGGAGGDW